MAKNGKTAKAGKKASVKGLPARGLSARQAKGVKGGSTVALPAVQKIGQVAAGDGSVRPLNSALNFQKV